MLRPISLFILLLFTTPIIATSETINKIVATVETQAITAEDLKNSSHQSSPELLEQEIFARLIKIDAVKNGLNTNEEEVAFYLNQIAGNQNQTIEQFLKEQNKKGLSKQAVYQELELEILKQKLASKLFQNAKSKINESSKISKVSLSQVVIDINRHGKDQAQKIAEQVIERYQAGSTFNLLVEDFSEDSFKAEQGELGLINWKDLDPNFQREIEKIEISEITAPILKGSLIFIFKLNNRILFEEEDSENSTQNLTPEEVNNLLSKYFREELYQKYLIDKK